MDRFVATVMSVLAGLLFSFFPAFGADLSSTDLSALNQSRKITLIHMGDIHGHLVAQPNLRSDSSGLPEGCLARLYTKIKEIRKTSLNTLLINTGDMVASSNDAARAGTAAKSVAGSACTRASTRRNRAQKLGDGGTPLSSAHAAW